ncbi:hypothetical protein N8I84_00975 [Streptomyces cynarae]|uniref:Uncharacterized protein n=1 Tax=Streptomyces cynarae TaxID=2981134 RepID=A0ABY6DWS5_9ACTN|nr:hypothetical protein [Streptomyces cynarae]UXY17496.1 hypothetical protein N8I84_00975 [Streptomyces cynarae]
MDRTGASRARRVLKAKVKELEKTSEVRGRGPAPALLVGQLRAAVQAAPDNLLGIRNRSIGLLHFALTAREHEVAYLRLRDIVEHENGLEVDVRVSKTAPRKVKVPFGSRPSTCPLRAWRAWKETAGLTDPTTSPTSRCGFEASGKGRGSGTWTAGHCIGYATVP